MDWRRTYIIGSGPSAAALDVWRLENGVTLGVNMAGLSLPVDAFFTMDRPWSASMVDQIAALNCEKHICLKLRLWVEPPFPLMGAQFWERQYEGPPTMKPGRLSSGIRGAGVSGVTAMNLAAQQGASEIVLIGFDMQQGAYRSAFGGPHDPPPAMAMVLENFRLNSLWYAHRGIKVINANPRSAIDCFEFAELESVYDLDPI